MLEKNYWLHRISHHSEASYPLLEKGYLSIGWKMFLDTEILSVISEKGEAGFRAFTEKYGITNTSRWSLWYFSQMKAGDIIVVPMYNKKFGVYEVLEEAKLISELEGITIENEDSEFVGTKEGIKDSNGELLDIGFIIKVKEINVSEREYTDPNLQSRMKMRQTNGNIGDLKKEVEEAMTVNTPRDIQRIIMEHICAGDTAKKVFSSYTSDEIEKLVKLYMDKMGASKTYIPAKNLKKNESFADADVIAEFEDLGLIFYIQVKKHEGESNRWAVDQIKKYTQDKQGIVDGVVHIPWALTTAEFSADTLIDAEDSNVRLIGGREFFEMLINAGINNLDVIK